MLIFTPTPSNHLSHLSRMISRAARGTLLDKGMLVDGNECDPTVTESRLQPIAQDAYNSGEVQTLR